MGALSSSCCEVRTYKKKIAFDFKAACLFFSTLPCQADIKAIDQDPFLSEGEKRFLFFLRQRGLFRGEIRTEFFSSFYAMALNWHLLQFN